MEDIYQMEKNGFTEFAGYTVGEIEKLLTSINFIKVNGNPHDRIINCKKKTKRQLRLKCRRLKKFQ